MLSSLQALALIDPPLPHTLPDACLLCCFTMKINKQSLHVIYKRQAARVSVAKISSPFAHALAPLAPRISSLSGSSARCCSVPPRRCAALFPPSDTHSSSLHESGPADVSQFERRPQVTWDELRTVLTLGVAAHAVDPPPPPGRAAPVNNLHTMVRAPHNNAVKDKQRSKWMSYASQNAAAQLPSLSSLLDDGRNGRALELKPLSSSFFHQPHSDPNSLAEILQHCSPLSATSRAPSSPSKSSPASPHAAVGAVSRVLLCDALPPAVLLAARPLFSSSLAGASAPDFIACIGAALQKSGTPTRFYFIVYFDTNSDHAVDNIATSMGRVVAVACYWITTSFDMARCVSCRMFQFCFGDSFVGP
jgi:hypothetical protein